jgi:AraC-like DNA-binding protein
MGRTGLEIAQETGFVSLGPFNRAFRAQTGQSPTELRRAGLEDVGRA